ncbi:uncharacterized protein BDR25DRAFT_344706 [Lindgomyces ingoldianus]|uniref:Uncharacterized protein n=1 Tax=Lindgomyces ingoldianus TaxID=673940 RepID=A0ACB6QLY1_9PLEO|nr:uncharacterized protein BDR25DRAFT_344706 [Lindgomyces ingoldianus]KAF2468014.1 hypothetical protein BDR25DRAFT_344706 [Lindgomyces ingoldianus]
MAPGDSQEFTVLRDDFYDLTSFHAPQDPSQLSQLLRQRAGDARSLQFTDSTATHPSASTNGAVTAEIALNPEPLQQQVPALRPPCNPTPRRAPQPTRYAKPSLLTHKTAPTSSGFVREREGGEKMHRSFAGAMDDVPGDTQPDSQMYKTWTSGIFDHASNSGTNPTSLLQLVEDGGGTPTAGSNGVKAVGFSPQQHSHTTTSPTAIPEDDPETQFRFDPALTSPLKFETPAMAGKKRDSQGQVLSSAMKTATTPGTTLSTAFFGAGGGNGAIGHAMSLTQVFNATQDGTSPIVGAPSDDPVFQRPSPNFTNARHSSPIQALSSPTKAGRTDPPFRSSSEPRAEYVTIKQSQERRARETLRKDATVAAQDSWGEPTEAQKQAAIRRARKQFDREAGKSFALVAAPARPTPRRGRRSSLLSETPQYKTPVALRTSRRTAVDEPTVLLSNEDDVDELSQPTPLNVDGGDDSLDELSQGIPSSSVRPSRTPTITTRRRNSADNRIQVANTSSHPRRTLLGRAARTSSLPESPSSEPHRESQFKGGVQPSPKCPSRLRNSEECVTIMDSQPDLEGIPRPKPLIIPSSPSVNQYSISQTVMATKTCYTSQVISSSMPPLPSRSSSLELGENRDGDDQEYDEERVPSSPPAIAHEDEIVYDEHSADEEEHEEEHNEEAEDVEEAEEGEGVNENVDIEDDDEVQNTGDGGLAETHDEDQELIPSSQPEHDDTNSPTHKPPERPQFQRQSTVPESDMPEDTELPSIAQPRVTEHVIEHDSNHRDESAAGESVAPNQTNSTELFHTAREDQTPSQLDNPSGEAPKDVEASSSEQARRFRSLTDIANLPETQQTTDVGDIEIPQLSFTDDLDDSFNQMLSGASPLRPAAKRRKVVYSAKRGPAFVNLVRGSDSASKIAPPSPLMQVEKSRENTPPFTNEREEEGVLAPAHAREEAIFAKPATLKSERPSASLQKTRAKNKKGALKPVNRSRLAKSTLAPRSSSHISEVSNSQSSSLKNPGHQHGDVEMPDAGVPMDTHGIVDDAGADEPDELAGPTPPKHVRAVRIVSDPADRGEAPSGEPLVPNRVVAYWPGGKRLFYPATCLGRADNRHLQIRYDDGNLHHLELAHIRAFDLRIGDPVKVDEIGMKKHHYVVVGFKDKIDVETAEEYPLTDRLGYMTVLLELKQRDSLLNDATKDASEVISVPMTKVYLTQQLWNKFRDRVYHFNPPVSPSESASRVATPSVTGDRPHTPSKSRRSTAGPSMLKDSINRAGSVSSSMRTGTVFANMAFAITATQDSLDRDSIANLITTNGGEVLEDGFHELFENIGNSSSFSSPPPKPSKLHNGKGKAKPKSKPSTSTTTSESGTGADELIIKSRHRNLGFVALISDSHSRRTKYIQALALNLPCLHYRWISDSLAANKSLPFAPYLLPAGIAGYLGPGVVRSRTIELYNPYSEDAEFAGRVGSREFLLAGMSVLLVMGKIKKDVERKKPYLFLTHALGPKVVGRCADLGAARTMIKGGEWDWVYVDGGKKGVENAEKVLFEGKKNVTSTPSASAQGRSKKRKRDDPSTNIVPTVRSGVVRGKNVKVVSDEFVIQSLILGALVEA